MGKIERILYIFWTLACWSIASVVLMIAIVNNMWSPAIPISILAFVVNGFSGLLWYAKDKNEG